MKKRSIRERFFGWLFLVSGWKYTGEIPPELKKYVIVVAPHTSNIDFFVGYGYKHLVGFHPNFLAKKGTVQDSSHWLVLKINGWVSGRPLQGKKPRGSVVDLYARTEEFIMTIAPEGTRSYSPDWKTGFYRIAHRANVPIIKIGFDYPSKTVYVAEPMYVSGDIEKEVPEIKEFFKQFTGRHPEKG